VTSVTRVTRVTRVTGVTGVERKFIFWHLGNLSNFSGENARNGFLGERFSLLKSKIGVPCSEIKINNEHPCPPAGGH
jgi:hypothetical protein